MIDSACITWLQPYPKQTDEQIIKIHNVDPNMSTWARDYKIEYEANCND